MRRVRDRVERIAMICPECGAACARDEVNVEVGMIYGPYGCSCGWSEDERYRHNPDPRVDSRGGFTPGALGDQPESE